MLVDLLGELLQEDIPSKKEKGEPRINAHRAAGWQGMEVKKNEVFLLQLLYPCSSLLCQVLGGTHVQGSCLPFPCVFS